MIYPAAEARRVAIIAQLAVNGPMRPDELAAATGISHFKVPTLLLAAKTAGLVEYHRDRFWKLTDEGKRFHRERQLAQQAVPSTVDRELVLEDRPKRARKNHGPPPLW